MKIAGLEKRLRLAGMFLIAGLLVEAVCLLWARPAEHTQLLATTRRKLNAPHHRAPRRFIRG